MVKIAPFRGYAYNPQLINESGSLLTSPPYDVLNQSQKEAYHKSHPKNFLHLDLGESLEGDENEMSWHSRSASALKAWLDEGVLLRRPEPAYYLIETDWTHPIDGTKMTRHGFIGLMRLEEASKKSKIRLHEKTFSYHKSERLHLMEATRSQFSPIFAFFPDPLGQSLKNLRKMGNNLPHISLTERSGLSHRVAYVEKPDEILALSRALADRTVYIADGHHRYETALNYRDKVRAEYQARGQSLSSDSALDYVMVYLCPMSDPGLCVLPTHRVIACIERSNEDILQAVRPYADIKAYAFGDDGGAAARDALSAKLFEDDKKGLSVFGLFLDGADSCYFLKIKEKIKQGEAEANPAGADLAVLDVSLLTNVLLKKALGLTEKELDDPSCISYISSFEAAYKALGKHKSRLSFILNPTSLDEIMKVTESGLVMPRKATYFYPKVSNGLVFNIIDPEEEAYGGDGAPR
jgi:uncharacterized protein (DUF1015 family)